MSDAVHPHVPGQVKFLVCVDQRPPVIRARIAARYACMRARNTGSRVALLHVMGPAEFQHWVAVGDVMEVARRVEAEMLIQSVSTEIREFVGSIPEVMLRECDIGEEILAQVEEDPSIHLLVFGAAAPEDKRFSLIAFPAGKLVGHPSIPSVVVPGNLDHFPVIFTR